MLSLIVCAVCMAMVVPVVTHTVQQRAQAHWHRVMTLCNKAGTNKYNINC